jgi:hypothetical protein
VLEASRPREQVENHDGLVLRSFSSIKKSSGFFPFLGIVTGRLVPSIAKDPLVENRFLQVGKGAENTKEKSRQCFTFWNRSSHWMEWHLMHIVRIVPFASSIKEIDK